MAHRRLVLPHLPVRVHTLDHRTRVGRFAAELVRSRSGGGYDCGLRNHVDIVETLEDFFRGNVGIRGEDGGVVKDILQVFRNLHLEVSVGLKAKAALDTYLAHRFVALDELVHGLDSQEACVHIWALITGV